MEIKQLYSRLDFVFKNERNVDCIVYTMPDGTQITGPAFQEFGYSSSVDTHGYQHITTTDFCCTKARFSPYMTGVHKWEAYSGGSVSCSGEFSVKNDGLLTGFVKVSPDKHYFCLDNGNSFVPIGCNLACPDTYRLPASVDEHFNTGNEKVTVGLAQYERRIKRIAENGGNYIRIWLSCDFFNFRTESENSRRNSAFYAVDRVVDMCRAKNIKVKLTFDHFRTLNMNPNIPNAFHKSIRDSKTGEYITDTNKWLMDKTCRERWLNEVKEYIVRFWNDPAIFAFELWNEMECIDAPFDSVVSFTREMLPRVRRLSPMNMVTNSLGSFDIEEKMEMQNRFADIPDMSFAQVHRYLDQGAPLEICRENPVELTKDAVERCLRKDKPLLLAETGAVNDRHTGPFRYYMNDYKGIIFDDCTFVPFFCGAAGTGAMWHISEYIEPHNLFENYKPFADMLHNVKIHTQHFKTEELIRKKAYVFVLRGRNVNLLYVRSKVDTWRNVMQSDCVPFLIRGLRIPDYGYKKAKLFPLNGEEAPACVLESANGHFEIPYFRRGFFIKIR